MNDKRKELLTEIAFGFAEIDVILEIMIREYEHEKRKIYYKNTEKLCTVRQNSALHKYFSLVAVALNEAGYDIIKTTKAMKEGVEIPWSRESVKELLWRFIQKSITNKHSTTKLNKKE